MLDRAKKYPRKGWAGLGDCTGVGEALRSCPLKGTREGGLHLSGWKSVPKDTGPLLEGVYREPLVHIELITLSQGAASGGPVQPNSPLQALDGARIAGPRTPCALREFSHYLFMTVNLSIKSYF